MALVQNDSSTGADDGLGYTKGSFRQIPLNHRYFAVRDPINYNISSSNPSNGDRTRARTHDVIGSRALTDGATISGSEHPAFCITSASSAEFGMAFATNLHYLPNTIQKHEHFPDGRRLIGYYPLHERSILSSSITDTNVVIDYAGKGQRHGDDDNNAMSGSHPNVQFSSSYHSPISLIKDKLVGAAKFGLTPGDNARINLTRFAEDLTSQMDFSVSFWIYHNSPHVVKVSPFGLHKDNGSGGAEDTFVFDIDADDSGDATNNETKLQVGHNLGTLSVTGSLEFSQNWRHVVLTCPSESKATLYVDGQLIGTYDTANVRTDDFGDASKFVLGGQLNTMSGGVDDQLVTGSFLSEFRFYDEALTANNARALFEQPRGPVFPGDSLDRTFAITNNAKRAAEASGTSGSYNGELIGRVSKLAIQFDDTAETDNSDEQKAMSSSFYPRRIEAYVRDARTDSFTQVGSVTASNSGGSFQGDRVEFIFDSIPATEFSFQMEDHLTHGNASHPITRTNLAFRIDEIEAYEPYEKIRKDYTVEFNDSVLDTAGWKNARYEGSKLTAEKINVYKLDDVSYGKNPVISNKTTAIYLGNSIIGGEDGNLQANNVLREAENSSYARILGHSYVNIDKILIIHPDTDKVELIERQSMTNTAFQRFINRDLEEGSVISMKLLDTNVENSLDKKHRVKFNRGSLQKVYRYAANDEGHEDGVFGGFGVRANNNSQHTGSLQGAGLFGYGMTTSVSTSLFTTNSIQFVESLPSELKQFEGDLVLETLGSELAPLSSSLTLVTAVQPPQTMEESEVDDGEGDGGGGDR